MSNRTIRERPGQSALGPDGPPPSSRAAGSTAPRTLVLLGINHNTAPIEVRERLAIPAARLADATRTLVHQPGIREGLILSTCNRVELLTLQEARRLQTAATPAPASRRPAPLPP